MLSTNRRFSTAPEQETAESIAELITTFLDESCRSQKDHQTVEEIRNTMKEVQDKRESIVTISTQEMNELSLKVDEETGQQQDLWNQLETIRISPIKKELDQEKERILEDINNTEHEISTLESKLEQLERKQKEMDQLIQTERELPLTPHLLALSIYQGLGVEFTDFNPVTKRYRKGIAKAQMSKRFQTINVDDDHTSFYYSNLLWDAVSR